MVTERKRVDGVKIISYGHQVPAGLVRRRRRDGLPVTAMDEINRSCDYSSPTPTQECVSKCESGLPASEVVCVCTTNRC